MSTFTNGTLYPSIDGGYPAGQIYTTVTSGTVTTNQQPSNLTVKGEATFEGDIKVKGISLLNTLEKIERRLAILQPNPDLESRWTLLKDLGDQYRAIEKDLMDKEKMWGRLKK